MRIVGCGCLERRSFTARKLAYFRERCVHEQETRFCVCCIDGSSRCTARAGEGTGAIRPGGAVRSTGEPDYRERKRFLLVCERSGGRCGAENAGRKLFLQADTGCSHVWPARWPCGRRFVLVLLAGYRRSKPSKGHRKNENIQGRPGGCAQGRSCVLQQGIRQHDRCKRQRDGETFQLQLSET